MGKKKKKNFFLLLNLELVCIFQTAHETHQNTQLHQDGWEVDVRIIP